MELLNQINVYEMFSEDPVLRRFLMR